MIEQLQQLSILATGNVSIAIAVFLRIGAAMAVLPAFGEQGVPQRVRLILALCLTVLVYPVILSGTSEPIPPLPQLIFSETVIGLAFGIALRLMILALQVAGTMAAQSTSLSQIFAGAQNIDPQPAIGHFLVVAGLALAAMGDLHVHLTSAFIQTYELFPLGQFVPAADLTDWGVSRVANAFSTGFIMAGPFVIAALVYNLALGVINRAMPQLMVVLVGAPAITLGGIVMLMLAAPVMLQVWQSALLDTLRNPFDIP